ncbi:MAG: helix-turn-helix domain-containing protein [Bacilli bacterium]|nr:helix-turn-helix domain-containing protein [Bacilli bacterium]
MTIYKAYKFRIYPNNEQKKVLNYFLGSSRFIFNYYLKVKDKLYKENSINYKLTDIKKDLVPLQTT